MAHNYHYVKTCALHNDLACAKRPLPLPRGPLSVGGGLTIFFQNPLEDIT